MAVLYDDDDDGAFSEDSDWYSSYHIRAAPGNTLLVQDETTAWSYVMVRRSRNTG